MAQLDVFSFPARKEAELHIRLQDFTAPTLMSIKLDGVEIASISEGISNKVHVIKLTELESDTDYLVTVTVEDEGDEVVAINNFHTLQTYEIQSKNLNHFKDFWIAVGQPGAYSNNMEYDEVFGMNERFGIKIKHAPYSPMHKIKNVVVQSWKDEDGDDVWLPRATGKTSGKYTPAITHEAVEYSPRFVIFGDTDAMNSNSVIRELLKLIEGRWLKVWDEYTQMGYEGVYLLDVDDDPKFKRRNYDFVEFSLKFKINGTNIDAPFEGVG